MINLIKAIKEENFSYVTSCLTQGRVNFEYVDDQGFTLLHYAVLSGNIDITIAILIHGADVNYTSEDSEPVLKLTILKQDVNMLKTLIQYGADVDIRDEVGYTPIYHAIKSGNKSIVKTLLEANAEINDLENAITYPLLDAIRELNKDIISLLLEYGANPNICENETDTPIHVAISLGDLDIIKMLLKKNANPNARYNSGSISLTPLHQAVYRNRPDIVKVLLKYGADVDSLDDKLNTPLHISTFKSKLSIVKLLLKYNPDLSLLNHVSVTCLFGYEEGKEMELLVSTLVLYRYTNVEQKCIEGIRYNWNLIKSSNALNKYSIKCENEICNMISTKCGSCSLLQACINYEKQYLSLISYYNNRESDLQKYKEYNSYIKKFIKKASYRRDLLNESLCIIDKKVTNNYWTSLPVEIKYMILSNISNKDLIRLTQKQSNVIT